MLSPSLTCSKYPSNLAQYPRVWHTQPLAERYLVFRPRSEFLLLLTQSGGSEVCDCGEDVHYVHLEGETGVQADANKMLEGQTLPSMRSTFRG